MGYSQVKKLPEAMLAIARGPRAQNAIFIELLWTVCVRQAEKMAPVVLGMSGACFGVLCNVRGALGFDLASSLF